MLKKSFCSVLHKKILDLKQTENSAGYKSEMYTALPICVRVHISNFILSTLTYVVRSLQEVQFWKNILPKSVYRTRFRFCHTTLAKFAA